MRDNSAFNATRPCPQCGNYTVMGLILQDEHGNHMHTLYKCLYWAPGEGKEGRCSWEGWSVPGWDEETEPEVVGHPQVPSLLDRVERIEKKMRDRGII